MGTRAFGWVAFNMTKGDVVLFMLLLDVARRARCPYWQPRCPTGSCTATPPRVLRPNGRPCHPLRGASPCRAVWAASDDGAVCVYDVCAGRALIPPHPPLNSFPASQYPLVHQPTTAALTGLSVWPALPPSGACVCCVTHERLCIGMSAVASYHAPLHKQPRRPAGLVAPPLARYVGITVGAHWSPFAYVMLRREM